MTVATLPARPRRAAARVVVPPAAGRLLWIEVKRNAVPWVLPLLALLVYLDTYRTVSGYPPVWTVRALAVPDRLLVDFAAFAGGFCAWAGSREGRRKTEDLLGTTARPAWTRQLAALAGTMFWLVLAFLAAVAVLYVQIARVAAWGGPPLWPVAVGLVALVTICVVGFTAGALFPGRFTAPLVAVGAVVLHLVGTHAVNDPNMRSLQDLLSLGTNVPPYDMGVLRCRGGARPGGRRDRGAAGRTGPRRAGAVRSPFYSSPITGVPPVYEFTVTITWVSPAVAGPLVQQGLLSDFIGGPAYEQSGNLGPAQQAVVSALLTAAGVSAQAQDLNGPPAPQVAAAANRFAALSPAARHAWLAAHLTALRAGHITLAQIP